MLTIVNLRFVLRRNDRHTYMYFAFWYIYYYRILNADLILRLCV